MNSNEFKGYDNVFSTRLRDLMDAQKVTQQTLADVLGTQRQTISKYIVGAALPSIDKLCVLAKFFKVSTDYLLGVIKEPSQNLTYRKIYEITGLTEESVSNLRGMTVIKPAYIMLLDLIIKDACDNSYNKPVCDSVLDSMYYFFNLIPRPSIVETNFGVNEMGQVKKIIDFEKEHEHYLPLTVDFFEESFLEKFKKAFIALKKRFWEDIENQNSKTRRKRSPNKPKEQGEEISNVNKENK